MPLPTLFFLHYLGGSRRTWAPVIELLADSAPTVAIDLPGFGDAVRTPGYGVADMAQTVSRVIRSHNPREWILVGHSMGAKVAAVIARDAENGGAGLDGLKGLVLVAGSPPGPEPMGREKRDAMLSWFLGDRLSSRAEAQHYVAENAAKPLAPALIEGAVEDVLRANRAAWVSWLESGSREDWAERVSVLKSPTLLIAGEEDDALGPAAQRQWMLPHFNRPQLVTLANAGHLLPLECPRDITPQILHHACLVR